MRPGLLATAIALVLVAGCGDGNGSQTLAEQIPAECRAGWSEYPPSSDGPQGERCQQFFSEHPDLVGSVFPPYRGSPPPDATEASSTPRPIPSRTARAAPSPGSSVAATAGQASASPAATTKPGGPPPASPRPSPTPQPTPSGPLLITEEDSGETFEIDRDTTDAVLRLGGGFYNWSQPELEGSSIELVQRQFVRDPGYGEWEIRPVSSGTTMIRSSGDPKCREADPPCGAPSRPFEVRVIVR